MPFVKEPPSHHLLHTGRLLNCHCMPYFNTHKDHVIYSLARGHRSPSFNCFNFMSFTKISLTANTIEASHLHAAQWLCSFIVDKNKLSAVQRSQWREMLEWQYYWIICRASQSKVYFQTFVTRFNYQLKFRKKKCPWATDKHADSCQLSCLKAWLLCESQRGVLLFLWKTR